MGTSVSLVSKQSAQTALGSVLCTEACGDAPTLMGGLEGYSAPAKTVLRLAVGYMDPPGSFCGLDAHKKNSPTL